jgi:hypothetical protein
MRSIFLWSEAYFLLVTGLRSVAFTRDNANPFSMKRSEIKRVSRIMGKHSKFLESGCRVALCNLHDDRSAAQPRNENKILFLNLLKFSDLTIRHSTPL